MRMRIKPLILMLLLISAGLMIASVPAAADQADFTLNFGNVGGLCPANGHTSPYNCSGTSGVQPPYATVHLELSGDSKTISLTLTMEGNYVLWSGNNQPIFGFNYVGGAGALNVAVTSGNGNFAGSQQMDGFGTFQYVIANTSNQSAGQTLTLTITRTNGGTFDSVNDIATGTYPFAIHMAPCDGCMPTGYAGGGDQPVPEPASMVLLGSGLLALGGFARRRRSKK